MIGAFERELKTMHRYLTIFFLVWLVNACANYCATAQSGGRDSVNPQPDKSGTTEPINTMSGANYFNENDLIVPCPGLSLEFVRGYNSAQEHGGCSSPASFF